jgi:N-acetylglucosamine malate deacetylase 1
MKNKVIVVTPHPDDETLGCGGTLLKHKQLGDEVHWLIITHVSEESGFEPEKVKEREEEIRKVKELYGFQSVYNLKLPPTKLDTIPIGNIVKQIGEIFTHLQPTIVYVPYRGDIHTDHAIVFDATIACTKWFRYPTIDKVLVYETLSETDFNLNPDNNAFRPNVYVDITPFLEKKIEIMQIYKSELAEHPFPRSIKSIKSLAYLRGSAVGFEAAEAFLLLRERVR